jgi:hypothetical protein
MVQLDDEQVYSELLLDEQTIIQYHLSIILMYYVYYDFLHFHNCQMQYEQLQLQVNTDVYHDEADEHQELKMHELLVLREVEVEGVGEVE